jgi:hypothetical protein
MNRIIKVAAVPLYTVLLDKKNTIKKACDTIIETGKKSRISCFP